MNNDMKDWPIALRKNAAVCELAAAIWRQRCAVWGGVGDFMQQPPHVRQRFTEIAYDVLQMVQPAPRGSVLPWVAPSDSVSV